MSLAASVDALIESALDSLRCGDTCPADSFCAAVDLVTASSPSDTGPLNSAGERLVECLLAVDRSARQDTALKLRVWRPLIVLLKRIHNDVSASTSTRLLGALISYVSGGVQSLMAMGGAEADDRGGPRGSLVDVLMFFLQRLGVALLYLHTDIAADQASEALGALAACRGALGQRDAAIVADQVLLRVLLSKTAVRNSEALREVFCVCSEEHAKNAGVDVSAAAYMCHATVGYLQFWIAVLAELAGDAAGEPGRTQLVPRGVGAALRCLQSLCLVHTGFVTDEFVVVSCFELGARLGAELQRGNIVVGVRSPLAAVLTMVRLLIHVCYFPFRLA